MAKVERFEDLEVWKTAREAVNAVYDLSANGVFSKDYALRDQIRRAAISIPSNIAEGFSRRSNKEFIQFLFIAKGSVVEVQSQLYTALDRGYIPQETFTSIYKQLEVIAKQTSRLITYLKERG